jgi:hypothetical protein
VTAIGCKGAVNDQSIEWDPYEIHLPLKLDLFKAIEAAITPNGLTW